MTVGEIIQRIQSLYSKGVQSDDSRLTSRHIYNKIITVRAKLLSQKANKRQKLNQWNFQTLGCVELIESLPYECPCLPPYGCQILRTRYQLPKPLTNLNNHLIQSVTSLDGSIVYSEIGWIEKKYKSSNKYTAKKPDYYIKDNYLYITTSKAPKAINITGLFEDPLVAENYPSYCNSNCSQEENCNENCESPLDKEFPIDNAVVDTLIEISSKELIMIFNQSIEDLSNDSKDNSVEKSK